MEIRDFQVARRAGLALCFLASALPLLSAPETELKDDAGKKTFQALTVNDRVVLALKFPGPVLEECGVFEFRVTFAEPPRHFAQPKAFAALPAASDGQSLPSKG